MTLYELTKRGKNESKGVNNLTPQKKSTAVAVKSPPKPPPMPPIVQRLLSCKRDTIYDKMKYSNLLKKAISILSPIHIKNLPEKLREEFEQKKRFIEEKEKMARMTPEERENYLKEKREQAKKVQKQKMLQRLKDQRRRFEDTDLQLTPLPQAKLVPTPDGFPNTLFGDVVMVTEFINCYSGLLMPESEYPIYTDALIKALVGGSSGFTYVSRVLTVLLHTLLQDHIAKVNLLLLLVIFTINLSLIAMNMSLFAIYLSLIAINMSLYMQLFGLIQSKKKRNVKNHFCKNTF